MQIYKTVAIIVEKTGHLKTYKLDTIWYEKKLWLVKDWHVPPFAGYRTPKRIVRLDNLAHFPALAGGYQLAEKLPIDVFLAPLPFPKGTAYEAVDNPEVPFPIGHA